MCVECIVKVLLDWMQLDGSDFDKARRQFHVLGSGFLGAANQAFVENLVFQHKHGTTTIARVSVPLNRVQNVFVEVRKMLESAVAAIQTGSVFDPIVDGLASTTLVKTSPVCGYQRHINSRQG